MANFYRTMLFCALTGKTIVLSNCEDRMYYVPIQCLISEEHGRTRGAPINQDFWLISTSFQDVFQKTICFKRCSTFCNPNSKNLIGLNIYCCPKNMQFSINLDFYLINSDDLSVCFIYRKDGINFMIPSAYRFMVDIFKSGNNCLVFS